MTHDLTELGHVNDPSLLRAVIDAADDALLIVDAEQAIRLFNAAAERMFARARAQTVGAPVACLVASSDVQDLLKETLRMSMRPPSALGGHEGRLLSLTGKRGDGTTFPMALRVTPGRGGGSGRAGSVVLRVRVDDRRAKERQQTALTPTHRASTEPLVSVGAMAMGAAHDVNNMLSPIILNMHLLADALPLGAEDRGLVDDCLLAAQRAQQVVERVVALGAGGSRREPYVIARGVREVAALRRPSAGEALRIRVEDNAARAQAEVNPAALCQALLNLCVNAEWAVRETPDPTIEVRVETVTVERDAAPLPAEVSPGRWIKVTVCDNGVGMPARVAARALEPMFSTRPPEVGTGMGLATVATVAADHGGAIALRSTQGQGTTVEFWLPRLDENGLAVGLSDSSIRRPTVLVLDEYRYVARAVAATLRRHGYSAHSATRWAEAMALATDLDRHVDLVLCAAHVPGVAQADLMPQLARSFDAAAVLLMASSFERLPDGHEACVGGLLAKPFSADELVAAADGAVAVARERRPLRPS